MNTDFRSGFERNWSQNWLLFFFLQRNIFWKGQFETFVWFWDSIKAISGAKITPLETSFKQKEVKSGENLIPKNLWFSSLTSLKSNIPNLDLVLCLNLDQKLFGGGWMVV